MNRTTAPWRASSIFTWSALGGCAVYARHVAASPDWLQTNPQAELMLALICVGLSVGAGLGVALMQRAYIWMSASRRGVSPVAKGGLSAPF